MIRLALYLPVIHAGYERFLRSWAKRGAQEVLLFGSTIVEAFPELRKDPRALLPSRAAAYLNSMGELPPARVADAKDLQEAAKDGMLVLPDEEICRTIVKTQRLRDLGIIRFDRTFLRWDRPWSQQGRPPGFDGRVSGDEAETAVSHLALGIAQRSSDWWRQVGAVAVLDGRVVAWAHNEHMPHEYAPYFNSDPRNAFSRGVRTDLTTALHAEAGLIAHAARRGQSLQGADLFVSTFPCPSCARLIARTGFRRCYFSAGYSLLDGEDILRAAGVELIFVDTHDRSGPGAHQPTLFDARSAESLQKVAEELMRRRSEQEGSPEGYSASRRGDEPGQGDG